MGSQYLHCITHFRQPSAAIVGISAGRSPAAPDAANVDDRLNDGVDSSDEYCRRVAPDCRSSGRDVVAGRSAPRSAGHNDGIGLGSRPGRGANQFPGVPARKGRVCSVLDGLHCLAYAYRMCRRRWLRRRQLDRPTTPVRALAAKVAIRIVILGGTRLSGRTSSTPCLRAGMKVTRFRRGRTRTALYEEQTWVDEQSTRSV